MTFYCDTQRHLVCRPYSRANLHKMAEQLGLKRCWFHGGRWPHYDIPKTRIVEIRAKATLITPRAILLICQGKIP